MRLICPNCGAQYEVGESVIPDGGRDVQCSNCGHTWFQRPASKDRELAEEMGLELPEEQDEAEGASAEAADAGTDAEHLPEDEFKETVEEEDSDHLPEDEFEEEEDEAGDVDERELTRRELDPGVAEILREEAERETTERAEERGGLETQPELGLESGDDSQAVRERMAHLRELPDDEGEDGEKDELAVAAVVAASNRRDLLPDIEEINSTLTATSEREELEDGEEREEKRKRSGFRRGFILSVLFFAVLALIYAYAPRIVAAYPASEPVLSAYVDVVNGLRLWVDGILQKAVEKLTALLSQVGGEGS